MQYPILCCRLFWDLIQRILYQQVRDQPVIFLPQTWPTNLPIILFNPSFLEHTGGTGGSELASHVLIKLSNADDQTSFFLFCFSDSGAKKNHLRFLHWSLPMLVTSTSHATPREPWLKKSRWRLVSLEPQKPQTKTSLKPWSRRFLEKTIHPSTLVKDGWKLQANVFFCVWGDFCYGQCWHSKKTTTFQKLSGGWRGLFEVTSI